MRDTYPLHCYRDALASLPVSMEDYIDADQVIGAAYARARAREGALLGAPQGQRTFYRDLGEPAPRSASGARDASAVPVPLLVLGSLAGALTLAGAGLHAARRLRRRSG